MPRSGTNGKTMVPRRILGFREKLLRPIRESRFTLAAPSHTAADIAAIFGSDRHLSLEQTYVSARSPRQRVHWSPGRDNWTDMDGNIYLSLQMPSPDAPVEDKILCLRGTRVHETLHTLRTDKQAFRRFVRKEMPDLADKFGGDKAQQIKTLWNIVEDGMIERWEQRYNPGGFEFIKTLNLLDPRVGREWSVDAEEPGQTEVRVPWQRDYAPVDIDGNELVVEFDANGDPEAVVIPVGTRFSQFSDRPIISLQSQAILAIQAEALPMFEPGALHPQVQAMLDEARPYILTAVNSDTNACIDAAYALESILRSHDLLPPEVRYDQNTGTSSVVNDQTSQGAQAPGITVSAPSSLDFDDPNAQKGKSGKKGKQGDEDDSAGDDSSSGPRRENDLRNQMGESAQQPQQQQAGQSAESGESGESGESQSGQPGQSGGSGESGSEGGQSGSGSDPGSSAGQGSGSSSGSSGGQPGGSDSASDGEGADGSAGENGGVGNSSGQGSESGSDAGDGTEAGDSNAAAGKDGTSGKGGKGETGDNKDGESGGSGADGADGNDKGKSEKSADDDGQTDGASGKDKSGKGAGADGDETGDKGDGAKGESGKGSGADGEGSDETDGDGKGSKGKKGKAEDGEAGSQDGVRDSGGNDGAGDGGQGSGGKKGNPAMGDQNTDPFGGSKDGMNGPNNKKEKGQSSAGGSDSSGGQQASGGQQSSGGQDAAGGADPSQAASQGEAGSEGGGNPSSSSDAKPEGTPDNDGPQTQGGGGSGGANLRDPDSEILYDPKKKEETLEKARQGIREQMRAQAVQDMEKEKRQTGRGYYNWRAPGNHHIVRQREIKTTVTKPVRPSPGVQKAATRIAKELERLRNQEAAAQHYLREGRYDKRAGVRARAGSENVRMRPGTMTEATMEMEVIVDLSGSTNDMREHIFEMATAFKLAGKHTKIPTSIWGYDGNEGFRHGDSGDATHYELASPDSEDLRALTKIVERNSRHGEPAIGGGGTPTASAIEFARTRLAHSTADKKLIVLVTDGASNNADATREQVRYAKGDEIAFLTCGFTDDSSLENNNNLSADQKKQMRENLLRGMEQTMDTHIGPGNWVAVQNYMDAPLAAGRKIMEMKRSKQRAR